MAAEYYRVQVTLPMDSGLPQDSVVNTWSFMNETTAVTLTDCTAIRNRLDAFYTSLSGIFSSQINPTNVGIKVYKMTDALPRLPVFEDVIDIGTLLTTGTDLPPEVAICLSFKAAAASGALVRRRRGRVYLGPVKLAPATNEDIFEMTTTMADNVATFAKTNILDANDDLVWAIYSPSQHHGVPVGGDINERDPVTNNPVYPENPALLAGAFYEVAELWVDNAWDTQRRRGIEATYRKTLT